MPAAAPRMAAHQPTRRQPHPAQHAVGLDGLDCEDRARGRVAADALRTERCQQRRKGPLIQANDAHGDVLQRIHALSFIKPASRNAAKNSVCTAAKVFPTKLVRTTTIMSAGRCRQCWFSRKDSRNKRRQRLRTTAGPSLRVVINPKRGSDCGGSSIQFKTKPARASRCPCCFNRAKSRRCRTRAELGNVNCAGIGWLGRRQLDFANAATSRKNAAAALGGHTCAKTMLPLAADFRRLIRAFHEITFVANPTRPRRSKQNGGGYQQAPTCQ